MTPPPPAAAVRLDEATLERLRELDPDGRHGVVRRVLVSYEGLLQRLLAQIAGDPDAVSGATLASVAHTLKSSSASVGALRLAQACEEIERRARASAAAAQRHDVERLRAECEAARLAVAAMLQD
jgi:HPt (histidine-containing phosphotransfer) domain-containing protein